MYVEKALKKRYNGEIVILKDPSCRINFKEDEYVKVLPFDIRKHPFTYILGIYHLATSRHVFVDNYFGFLASATFRDSVTCVQLWHAAGAVKKFGLKDPTVEFRLPKARERFLSVYQTFDQVVVGSEKMATIFKESFGIDDQKIMRTGIPRTDFFFENEKMSRIKKDIEHRFPLISGKKVILYAPTFRDNELKKQKIRLNLEKLRTHLKDDYVFLIRLHPAVQESFDNPYPDFIMDVTSYPDVNELLVITDILITDYSSIPYEFALLNRPMIFYAYDFKEYTKMRGFWEDYFDSLPGPILTSTDDVLKTIQNRSFRLDEIHEFASTWNQYSNGNSSEKLIEQLYD
ncbi:CDP-glycerol glycerophosphotransferase (TagB/SpsB family) [Thalassobacillus pellis]|nr:CDP-glycerol glycerophosphotransferase (TagB/SpsB family) [Thalassobacillus pellis]